MPRVILDPAILSRSCSPLNSASVAWGTAVSKMVSMASGPLVFLICVFRLLPARHLHWPSLTCAVKLRGGLGEPESSPPYPASALPKPLAAKIWSQGPGSRAWHTPPPYGYIEICQNTFSASIDVIVCFSISVFRSFVSIDFSHIEPALHSCNNSHLVIN